jgi:hypothetical protein
VTKLPSSPELALLLRCLACDDSRDEHDALALLCRAVANWDILLELAQRHAVVPLVDQRLSRFPPGTVPPDVVNSLRTASQAGAVGSLQLSGSLVAAQRVLAAAGVDAMPFKGPTLATLLYASLSLRQYQDLDILVHPGSVESSRQALMAIGYLPVLEYSEDQRDSVKLSGHHEQFVNAADETTIELHWTLNNRSLTHDSFEHQWWENRQTVSIGGAAMRTLGPEQLILYLCMHGGKHSWARLSWLCDFQRALRKFPDADWNRIWALAAENGAARMVRIGLALVDELFDGYTLTKPATVGRRSDPDGDRVTALITARLLSDEVQELPLDFAVQLRSRERRRDQLRYTWHVLATPHPADVSLLGLPRALHGAYYVVRPVRLVLKHLVLRLRSVRVT